MAIALAGALEVRAASEPPIIRTLKYLDDASIQLDWFHPGCFTDTITAHKGPYAHPFVVDETRPGNRIAIRLPACSSGALLHNVTAYFMAKSDVTAEAWSIQGSFVWSRHADSMGVPGPRLDGPVTSAIGEIATLKNGGHFTQPLDWFIPDSNATWLVGSWPGNSQQVVRLGADAQPGTIDFLVGCTDNGSPLWIPYPDNGILVKAVILYSDSAASASPAMADSFLIERHMLAGPTSPRFDSSIFEPGTSLRWSDSVVIAGQSLRYSISAFRDGEKSPATASDVFTIPERWPVGFAYESISLSLLSAIDTVISTSITNLGPDSLAVVIAPAVLTATSLTFGKQVSPPAVIAAMPESFILPPGHTQPLAVSITVSGLTSGAYGGWLVVRLSTVNATLAERHAVPITVSIDQATAIFESDDDNSGTITPQRELAVTAGPSPFRESITLTMAPPASQPVQGKSHIDAADPLQAAVEVTVFNSLGHRMKRELVPLQGLASSGSSEVTLSITGTHAWPSGVYLVSVRYQGLARTVKLLHLK